MLGFALQSGFQFFGLFDHGGDLLVAAGASGLFYQNGKLTLLENGSGIDNRT